MTVGDSALDHIARAGHMLRQPGALVSVDQLGLMQPGPVENA